MNAIKERDNPSHDGPAINNEKEAFYFWPVTFLTRAVSGPTIVEPLSTFLLSVSSSKLTSSRKDVKVRTNISKPSSNLEEAPESRKNLMM